MPHRPALEGGRSFIRMSTMRQGPGDLQRCKSIPTLAVAGGLFLALATVACRPASYRKEADRVAGKVIDAKQREALGKNEPFTIETPADTLRRRLQLAQKLPTSGPESVATDVLPKIKHWPEKHYPTRIDDPNGPIVAATPEPVRISLVEALQVAAANSREYQSNKEEVFLTALDLDLANDEYRNTFTGLIESVLSADHTAGG